MVHLEGRQCVLAALAARRRRFDAILLRQGLEAARCQDVLDVAAKAGVPVRYVEPAELDALAHGATHGGIVAVCSEKPAATPEELLALIEGLREPALLLLLEGVDDARNLGFILRTAEAMGVDAVLLRRRAWDLDEVEVSRPSSGAYERLMVFVFDDLALLAELKRRRLSLYGCVPNAQRSMYEAAWTGPSIIALGGEKRGLSGAVRDLVDRFISIPTVGGASSLSLSHAAAIVLAEAQRQRLVWRQAQER
jgi:23S rRNA (guanosine2251-2'-O)-methyltransferase